MWIIYFCLTARAAARVLHAPTDLKYPDQPPVGLHVRSIT